MAEPPLRYAVLLTDPSALRPAALARLLGPLKGLPAQDLLVPLRRCWGILEEDVEEAAARAQAEALTAAGFPALALPRSLLEDPPAAEPLRALESPLTAALLAAAVFTVTTSKTVKVQEGPGLKERAFKMGLTLATGLPLGSGKREVEKTVTAADLVYYADVYAGAPPRRWRIDARDFDYSCLKQRMGYDAEGNFRLLLETLAPGARLNRGAEGLLARRPVRELGYESLSDLDREGRWLLTLAALKPS